MMDKHERKLQGEYDVAGQLLAAATKRATEATQEKNRARQKYKRALYALVMYRERRDAQKPTQ